MAGQLLEESRIEGAIVLSFRKTAMPDSKEQALLF
jgi:hypothetical protein